MNKFEFLLNEISVKTNYSIDEINTILVEQAKIQGYIHILKCIIAFLVIAVCIYIAVAMIRDSDEIDPGMSSISLVLIMGIFIIFLIFFVTSLELALSGFLNPEWYIINEMIKGGI